jgi:hypothetical protein
LNPYNPNSIYFPESPNYNPSFGFPETYPFGFAPGTGPAPTTSILFNPSPITYTPPPTETPVDNTPSPNYVGPSNPRYSP